MRKVVESGVLCVCVCYHNGRNWAYICMGCFWTRDNFADQGVNIMPTLKLKGLKTIRPANDDEPAISLTLMT